MDRFLEANRLVESSLVKLKRETMPLRKALLVSNVINRAQQVATSAHLSFMNTSQTTPNRPSKLLASMTREDENETITSSDLYHTSRQSSSNHTPSVSPVALTTVSANKEGQEDDVMEFISNSVLSDILKDDHTENGEEHMEIVTPSLSKPLPWSPLSDVSNWPSWTKPRLTLEQCSDDSTTTLCSPPSPGKRQHGIAFPCDNTVCTNSDELLSDVTKRFKINDPLLSSTNPFISSPSSLSWSFNNDNFSLNWSCIHSPSPPSSNDGPSHKLYSTVLAY